MLVLGRPNSPGSPASVWLLVVKTEEVLVPIGTCFAVSTNKIVTAYHNLTENKLIDGGRWPKLKENALVFVVKTFHINGLYPNEIYQMNFLTASTENDWAIMERQGGEFADYTDICGEDMLPAVGADIGIKDYSIGLMISQSTPKVPLNRKTARIVHYARTLKEGETFSTCAKILPADSSREVLVEDTVMVQGGHVSGSCGAPYFAANGLVFAFHYESVDESTTGSIDSGSHASFSHGRVLCLLKNSVLLPKSIILSLKLQK